jgi:hypothetical protein
VGLGASFFDATTATNTLPEPTSTMAPIRSADLEKENNDMYIQYTSRCFLLRGLSGIVMFLVAEQKEFYSRTALTRRTPAEEDSSLMILKVPLMSSSFST